MKNIRKLFILNTRLSKTEVKIGQGKLKETKIMAMFNQQQ